MTLIIAGERSGVGKTTITLALLSFLAEKNYRVQSFKVGPDYIDPMFHSAITGLACRNLDPILTSENYVKSCFEKHTQNVDYSLIEGVMGLYDGVSINNFEDNNEQRDKTIDYASTAHIARILGLPVVLVIDCSKLSTSIAAIASGYRKFDQQVNIIGVILNKVASDRHLELLTIALESIQIEILGVFYRYQQIEIRDRHLGLIPTEEIKNINNVFQKLAQLAQDNFNWSKILPHLKTKKACNNFPQQISLNKIKTKPIRIAVAKDKAFNFYYQDNLDILEQLGAEIVFWSPIKDEKLPKNTQGLYLGGGFPEIFAEELSNNQQALNSVKTAILNQTPTYAECGGFMYLSESITSFNNQTRKMVGVLPTKSIMTKKLTLGYRQIRTIEDNCFSKKNIVLKGHEFHRSQTSNTPNPSLLEIKSLSYQQKPSYQGWKLHNVYASYIHLHFANCLFQINSFLKHCHHKKKL